MSYRMKNYYGATSIVPIYQSDVNEYNVLSKINTLKFHLHNIYLEIEDMERKIDFIEGRLRSKVPITTSRKLELEAVLENINNKLIDSNKSKDIIESELNDLKRSLIDIQNILY